MKKHLFLAGGLLLVAALGAGLWFYFSLDGIVRRAIVSRLEEATGVDVRLQAVHLNAANQSGELVKFRLANPPGYPRGEALFRFERAEVGLDVATLRQPVVRIRSIELRSPIIFYSGNASGNNLKALAAQVAARDKANPAPQDVRRVSIGSFVIADARIRINLPGVNHTPELELGTVRFSNLGGKDGSAPGEIMSTISATLSDRATAKVVKSLPRMAVELGLAPEKLAEMLGVPVPGPVRQAADFLRGIFGR
jgi:uncharacterized protein involved in outer membrane biogenesis